MEYIGRPQPENPNVIQLNGEWTELKRYDKDEISCMLIDPSDDLALTKKNLSLFYSKFSYEYSLYFACAKGKDPLKKCFRHFQQMKAFNNSWYYVVKLWKAPGEHVSATDLKDFIKSLDHTDQLGEVVMAVGHDEKLKPSEVRMLLITYYNERRSEPFEDEWSEKCSEVSIKDLMKAVPDLKKTIDNEVKDEYQEDVYYDQINHIIINLRYDTSLSWTEVETALDYFYQQGSSTTHAVNRFLYQAWNYSKTDDIKAIEFYLQAILWALNHGSAVNDSNNIDLILYLATKESLIPLANMINEIEKELLKRGAMSGAELDSNTDYFKELDQMRTAGT